MANERIILDKRRIKNDGKYPVKIYVRSRREILIPTQFSASENNFDGGEFTKKEPNFRAKNAGLQKILSSVINEMVVLESSGRLHSMDDKQLKIHLQSVLFPEKANKVESRTFVDYLDEFISTKGREGTRTCYNTTRNKILSFDPGCTFETMDKKWLDKFERWMSGSGMKVNAYAIHLRNIRAVFNYAIDNEYTSLYPFRKFRIKKEETRKRSLSVGQLRELIGFKCEPYQERYRDMFVLMFYLIGINAVDLFLAKPEDVVNGRLEYKRAKTGKLYSIKIEPEAMSILEKYKGKNYLLNIMDEYKDYKNFLHRMGIALKEIGSTERKGRGGKKIRKPLFPDISSYWSRHTWATIAAELDIPKETISEALGHSIGSDVTSIYIRFDIKKVDEANRKVIDYVLNG